LRDTSGKARLARRADFLAQAYGEWTERGGHQIAQNWQRAEAELRSAAERYERVVLWFEHDIRQLVLARCFASSQKRRPAAWS
jgi:hypothetical protein